MDMKTHLAIDESLSGRITRLEEGYAEVALNTRADMCADEKGLIHGGFVFTAADYAAMAAVNDPNVVLGSAEVRFMVPVVKGDTVVFRASAAQNSGKKRIVSVVGLVEDRKVFEGYSQHLFLKSIYWIPNPFPLPVSVKAIILRLYDDCDRNPSTYIAIIVVSEKQSVSECSGSIAHGGVFDIYGQRYIFFFSRIYLYEVS